MYEKYVNIINTHLAVLGRLQKCLLIYFLIFILDERKSENAPDIPVS